MLLLAKVLAGDGRLTCAGSRTNASGLMRGSEIRGMCCFARALLRLWNLIWVTLMPDALPALQIEQGQLSR